jgi:carbonic anhydrase
MSCLNSTAPIDISSGKVAGECVEKCAFTYKYPTSSTCSGTNRGTYISLLYDKSSNPPVTYNTVGYDVSEVRIYSPSLHTYNSKQVAAEIIIIHNSTMGGKPLLVSIPIIKMNSATDSANLLDKMITSVAKGCPSEGDCSNINIDSHSLNTFVKPGAFYSYSGTTPYQPCSQDVEFVVYGINAAANIMDNTLKTLNSIVKASGIKTVTTNKSGLYMNPKGSNQASSDEIYIDCQPVNTSEETIEISKKKSEPTPINFDSIVKNPVFIAIMGSLVFLAILYAGKMILEAISGKKDFIPAFISDGFDDIKDNPNFPRARKSKW